MIFFTADTHFGHERTRVLHKRPFTNVVEMNAALIANWNSTVGAEDIVYHLGDFGTPDPQILQQLNGRLFFLPSQDYDDEEVVRELSLRATIIQPNTILVLEGETYQLIHEPSSAVESENFFLYGHIHRLQMVKRNGLCVSSDVHFFKPISLETVLFFKKAIENHYDENVFTERLGSPPKE